MLRPLSNALEFSGCQLLPDELIEDAHFVLRDKDVLEASLQEAINDEASRLMREDKDRIEELQPKQNKTLAKKNRKSVLVNDKGAKRNHTETIVERIRILRFSASGLAIFSKSRDFRRR